MAAKSLNDITVSSNFKMELQRKETWIKVYANALFFILQNNHESMIQTCNY